MNEGTYLDWCQWCTESPDHICHIICCNATAAYFFVWNSIYCLLYHGSYPSKVKRETQIETLQSYWRYFLRAVQSLFTVCYFGRCHCACSCFIADLNKPAVTTKQLLSPMRIPQNTCAQTKMLLMCAFMHSLISLHPLATHYWSPN